MTSQGGEVIPLVSAATRSCRLHGSDLTGREKPSNMRQTLAPWLVLESDLPRVIHELTLAQSATFVNAEGVTVRVSADPKEHSFRFEEVKDEDEFE